MWRRRTLLSHNKRKSTCKGDNRCGKADAVSPGPRFNVQDRVNLVDVPVSCHGTAVIDRGLHCRVILCISQHYCNGYKIKKIFHCNRSERMKRLGADREASQSPVETFGFFPLLWPISSLHNAGSHCISQIFLINTNLFTEENIQSIFPFKIMYFFVDIQHQAK